MASQLSGFVARAQGPWLRIARGLRRAQMQATSSSLLLFRAHMSVSMRSLGASFRLLRCGLCRARPCVFAAAHGRGRPPKHRWQVRLPRSMWQRHACQRAQLPPCRSALLTRRRRCKARCLVIAFACGVVVSVCVPVCLCACVCARTLLWRRCGCGGGKPLGASYHWPVGDDTRACGWGGAPIDIGHGVG